MVALLPLPHLALCIYLQETWNPFLIPSFQILENPFLENPFLFLTFLFTSLSSLAPLEIPSYSLKIGKSILPSPPSIHGVLPSYTLRAHFVIILVSQAFPVLLLLTISGDKRRDTQYIFHSCNLALTLYYYLMRSIRNVTCSMPVILCNLQFLCNPIIGK